MNDQNDDAQTYALMVLAGAVALVIGGVLTLAVRSGLLTSRPQHPAAVATVGTVGTVGTVAAVPAPVARAIAGEPEGRVYFALDSAALPADANEVLVRVADSARAQSGKVVLISGFHDASGDAAANTELAKRRAEAVRHALEADGVTPDRLVLDKPAVTTGGSDPREARRVEMRLR